MGAIDLCKLLIRSDDVAFGSLSLITPKQRSYERTVKPRQAELSAGNTVNLFL